MTDKELVKQLIVNSQVRLETIDSVERNMKLPISSGKIITVPGVRRCGKSTLLLLTIKQLLAKGVERKQILFFNFDDERIKWDGQNLDTIIVAYRELYPDIPLHDVYMFFDARGQMYHRYERRSNVKTRRSTNNMQKHIGKLRKGRL